MHRVRLKINDLQLETAAGSTILDAARDAGIYIPTLCHHPDLPSAHGSKAVTAVYQGDRRVENAVPGMSAQGCGLCVAEVRGEPDLVASCCTEVREGMVVETENGRIREVRRKNLVPVLERHPHACLACTLQEGCSRTHCSANVPEMERCCSRFGNCELQNVVRYVGISDAAPGWVPTDLPKVEDAPLFEMDPNLCIGCTRCVRACRDLRGIEAIGFVLDENGRVQVGTVAKGFENSGCRFCTACVAVCPTGALADRTAQPGTAAAADLLPCKAACPVHLDVPGYLRLLANGRREEAHAVIREKVPFPGILGRVCVRYCETVCRRGEIDAPVAICALERYASDGETRRRKAPATTRADTGKKVAVVGAGPAGLTAAFYLCKAGHRVTVFDSEEKAGGMMRTAIPGYRLPQSVLDREVSAVFELGIEFRPCQTLGVDFTLEGLKTDGFEAVFIGVGSQAGRVIDVPGCESEDVLLGVDFLKQVNRGEPVRLKENVVVVGGGNVAVDAAMTALRCGAERVWMASLEGIDEMPAGKHALGEALAEGILLLPCRGVQRVLSENGKVTGIELAECIGVADERGRFRPQFGRTDTAYPVDQVILAAGQTSDLSFLDADNPIRTRSGVIRVDAQSGETAKKRVWAGGDVTGQGGSVVRAIAAGRKAAASMDRALGGTGEIEALRFQRGAPDPFFGKDPAFIRRPREQRRRRDAVLRIRTFEEIVAGFDTAQAVREAGRCLQCDLRLCLGGNPAPPSKWLAFNAETIRQEVPASEGVYRLFSEDHDVLAIKGTANLRSALLEALAENVGAALFDYEKDPMFSRRESEQIQRHLQEHGRMPGVDDDDLF